MTKEEKEQLKRSIFINLSEFNSKKEYEEIRKTYKYYFSDIKNIIIRTNPKLASEDIINLNPNIKQLYLDIGNSLLFQEINRGIKENIITESDIK